MKKIITFFIVVISLQLSKAQYVTIPDPNFASWLQSNIPIAMNGNQMDTTSLAVTTLTNISIGSLGISDITGVQFFDSLKILYCYSNLINNLPNLPPRLVFLDCSDNFISQLPSLPNSLNYIFCSYNQLTVLPMIPNALLELKCNVNQLTTLPPLPNTLKNLDCSSNPLSQLPILPSSLIELNCSHCQLSSIPDLPFGLSFLDCSHNNITCFPIFPYTIQKYKATGSASPVKAFYIEFNPFTCLPNYITAMDSATQSFPLCIQGDTVNNPNGCVSYKSITGFIYRDNNNDCSKSSLIEIGIPTIPIKLYDNNNSFIGFASSNPIEGYNISVPVGNYLVKIDTLNKSYAVQCNNPGIDSVITINTSDLLIDSVDFPVVCKPGIDLGVQSIFSMGLVAPGQTHQLYVYAGDITTMYYLNCGSGISGNVSFFVNGPVTYVGPAFGSLTPTVTGNLFSYNISDFSNINKYSFGLIFITDTTALSGNVICVNATVTPVTGDYNLSNNNYNSCYTIQNSQDPNYKEVYPVEVQPGFNDWLTYTIHFQNTGSGQAMNIKLADILDSKLNLETFEIITSSNNITFNLMNKNLFINFPNVNLGTNSIGFIQYKIKPNINWVNDTIRNKASIYFDYNPPIVTNTTKNYYVTTTNTGELKNNSNNFELFPNPTDNILLILSKNEFTKVEVLSLTGQILLSKSANAKTYELELQNFTEGIYFVKIDFPDGTRVLKKVIKQ